jgi:hypothetical protein
VQEPDDEKERQNKDTISGITKKERQKYNGNKQKEKNGVKRFREEPGCGPGDSSGKAKSGWNKGAGIDLLLPHFLREQKTIFCSPQVLL